MILKMHQNSFHITSYILVLQDQLVGDSALRMLAATVNEAMLSIPPPSKPNHITTETKASNGSIAQQNNIETKKSASLIATKKAPSKQTDNSTQDFMNTLFQAMASSQMQTQPGKLVLIFFSWDVYIK